jgi:Protein of unknown function (DUF1552)
MSIRNRVLWQSRRAFLGGAGTLVALPFLESLAPRKALAAGSVPKRFVAWYWACGIPGIADWKPTTVGMNWQPSLLLQNLMPIKQKVSILSGLRNAGHGPDHTYGTGAFLTGTEFVLTPESVNQSIDQVIADDMQTRPNKPPIHSMQLGPYDTNCEPFGHCGFLQNISFGKTGTPITKETDAQNAFNRLFMGTNPGASDAAAQARLALRKSVLDAIHKDATSLSGHLSRTDKARFDEYLTSVRKVEDQISGIGMMGGGGMPVGGSCSMPKMPDGLTMTAKPAGDLLEAEINAFTSVMALAFQCDLTRVIAFMMTSGGTRYAPMGLTDYHLGITHHGVGDWQPKFRTVVSWIVLKYAAFLQKLDAMKDIDGVSTVLDNTVVFGSSEICDGNAHNHTDMPVLLGGGLGGSIKPGQHIQFSNGETFADLFMWIAKSMGLPPMTKFGATGTGLITSLGA